MTKYQKDKGLDAVFANFTGRDGQTVGVNGADFLVILKQGLDQEHPDAEATDRLKFWLKSMLDYADTQQDLQDNDRAVETLTELRKIYKHLLDQEGGR